MNVKFWFRKIIKILQRQELWFIILNSIKVEE